SLGSRSLFFQVQDIPVPKANVRWWSRSASGRMIPDNAFSAGGLSVRALMLVGILLVGASVADAAALYDGSVPMKCTIETVFVCHEAAMCTRGTAQTVSLPSVVTVDVGNRLISGSASGRTARITSFGRGAGQLMIHGEEAE